MLAVAVGTGPGSVQVEVPEPPAAAREVFGVALPSVESYVRLLANAGVERGLIGPREVPRLWDRHVLNSAALADLIPRDARVLDVGSGAGLPGLPLALRRPDLHVWLLDPMARRCAFLVEAVAALALGERVVVRRGRAEELSAAGETFDVVTARAVAPLSRLVPLCLPLLRPTGVLLALKGASAAAELAGLRPAMGRLGVAATIQTVPTGDTGHPATIVTIRRTERPGSRRRTGRR